MLAFAAAAPFSGVPPQGVSGSGAQPGTVAIDTTAHGELVLTPSGQLLPPTPIRTAADPDGPTAKLTIQNIGGVPLRLVLRLVPVTSSLGDAVLVRASVAGSVVFDGTLRSAETWSLPTRGAIKPGESSTLRLRLQLRDGAAPEDWLGREDVRRLEFQTVRAGTKPPAGQPELTPQAVAPSATTPAQAGESGR